MATQNLTRDSALRQSGVVSQLRDQIRSVETASRIAGEARVSSGCSAIDRILPNGGYQRGTLVQWLTGGGQAADYLSLLAAKQAALDGGAIVVFDPWNQFYPPAAAAIGIHLDNLIMLKSASKKTKRFSQHEELDADLLWSIDQALRCPAVAAVWGTLGRIGERWFRRFQLSAESSGCLGLFVQPTSQIRQPSWADVQWVCNAECGVRNAERGMQTDPHSAFPTPHSALVLSRCRGAQTGKRLNLSINNITGNVQSVRRDHERLGKTGFGDSKSGSNGQRTSAANPRAMVS